MSEASPKGESRDGRNTKSPGAILHERSEPEGGVPRMGRIERTLPGFKKLAPVEREGLFSSSNNYFVISTSPSFAVRINSTKRFLQSF